MKTYLEKRVIEHFTAIVDDQEILMPEGYQYVLTIFLSDGFTRRCSWFLSSEETVSTEDFGKLIIDHLNILTKDLTNHLPLI